MTRNRSPPITAPKPPRELPLGLISEFFTEEKGEDEKDCGEFSLDPKIFSASFLL
jgi:hypothetical protein